MYSGWRKPARAEPSEALMQNVYIRTVIRSPMIQMPNADRADISEMKVFGYLLNPAHPDGASKAAFFTAMGFRRTEWRVLRQALALVARTGRIQAIATSTHGEKYIIDGAVNVPRGGEATIRTIWIIDADADIPRLVTAYPTEEHDDARA